VFFLHTPPLTSLPCLLPNLNIEDLHYHPSSVPIMVRILHHLLLKRM
jgi:hypothetical protein